MIWKFTKHLSDPYVLPGVPEIPGFENGDWVHSFLSNFYPARVRWEGLTYPTVEHAFQAAKVLPASARGQFARLEAQRAGTAKKWGKQVHLRPDWEQIKLHVMRELVRQKFTIYEDFRLGLLATDPDRLIEGNTWGDDRWGVIITSSTTEGTIEQCPGANALGIILEEIRMLLGAVSGRAVPTQETLG